MKRTILVGCALALVLAACAGSREDIVGEFVELPSTPITTAPTTTTTTTVPLPTLPIEEQIALLAGHAREIRGLPLAAPALVFVPTAELEAGYRSLYGLARTGDDRFDAAYLRTLGVLEDGQATSDIESFCSVPGFYDPDRGTLVLDEGLQDDGDGLTPFGRRHLVGELLSAASDQAFGWWDTMSSLRRSGDGEAAIGLWGLVLGDTTFHADQYVQENLNSTEQFAIRLEEIACQQGGALPPPYVTTLQEYGPVAGRVFVESLIAAGGAGTLDAAYSKPPVSSEQIFHPPLFGSGEGAIAVDLPPISATGFTEADRGVFGERRLRALLSEGVTVSQALQAATGWGGDAYRVLWNGSDVVLVLLFEGDEARDARELAETLGGWASASLRVGAGRPDNSGLAFEGEEYAFVAHDDTTMLLVVSNDAVAGRSVRDIFWPRW